MTAVAAAAAISEPAASKREPPRPYKIHLEWISGSKLTLDAQRHVETDNVLTVFLNDRRDREVTIPFSNLMLFEVDRG